MNSDVENNKLVQIKPNRADLKWGPIQRALFIGLLLGSACLAVLDITLFIWLFSLMLITLYSVVVSCKVLAALAGVLNRFTIFITEDTYNSLTDEELPIYTILLPVYKEAGVIEKLITNIGDLDYPKEKLDVKLLLELDDTETLETVQKFGIPDWCELILIPDNGPKTKPRACNVGLAQARGEFLVIYDAEDRPEKDQLKKVICAYKQQNEKVICLQAKLNFFNAKENLLSRCFALEYTCWFDLYLPGLHAIRAPIPLGGTSNHFKTDVLKELDGWDPYNVTEDCDLGIRIAEAGYQTRIVDSVTWEEAPIHVSDWLGQRSRWIKGYFQTFWVHSRQPFTSFRKLGPWGFLHMLITVGGQVATVFFNPICWIILIAWLYFRWPIVYVHSPYTLVLFSISLALFQFNFLFMFVHVLGAIRRRQYGLACFATFLPFYWMLVSIGAWRGVLEFFWSPHKWVKTTHGLSTQEDSAGNLGDIKRLDADGEPHTNLQYYVKPSSAHGFLHKLSISAVILSLFLCISAVSIQAPAYFGHSDRVDQARIAFTENYIETEQEFPGLTTQWTNQTHLNIRSKITCLTKPNSPIAEGTNLKQKDIRLMYYLKVRDGEWFHKFIDDFHISNNQIDVDLALETGWDSMYDDSPWSIDYLQRVRALGLRIYYGDTICSQVELTSISARGEIAPPETVHFTFHDIPTRASKNTVTQINYSLNKSYNNPFDSDIIKIDAVFKHSNGNEQRVPAFFTQDYHQSLSTSGEVLRAKGAPHWAVRFTPRQSGSYTWHLEGEEQSGHNFKSPTQQLQASDSEERGFIKVGKNPRYFAYDNDDFFYPLILNIRSPRDEINHDYFDFEFPKKEDGSYVLYDYLQRMQKVGINVGRVWMSPWFGGLEWNAAENGFHGLGVYNLQNAYRIDQILNRALNHGIMIELALNHHGPFTEQYDSQWKSNPYNKRLGGPARSPRDIMTNQESKEFFKKRLRYTVARYGAYPNLFAYILWIEANVVDPREPVLTQWHKEFGPWLKEIDGGRHIVTTEFNNNGYPRIWKQDNIDYTQIAGYNFGSGLINVMRNTSNAMLPYDKPAVLEEYMGLPAGGSMPALAHEYHDGLWAGWVLPFSAAPMPWWWNFIFEKDIDTLYSVFNEYTQGEDLSLFKWEYLSTLKITGAPELNALARCTDDRAFFWVYKDVVSNNRFRGPYNQRRKAFSENYKRRVPNDFSPIKAITSDEKMNFIDIKGAKLVIPACSLSIGSYRVEFWDTWRLQKALIQDITISSYPYELSLPNLGKDIAIKLRKIENQLIQE